MKPDIIKITNHLGEIENGHGCTHLFYGGNLNEYEGEKHVFYHVSIHVIENETNTILKVDKDFETKIDAINYLKMFVSKKPICEGIIIEKYEKEVCHYV